MMGNERHVLNAVVMLAIVVTLRLAAPAAAGPACGPDLDGNGVVNAQDLALLLAVWGVCPDPPAPCAADLDDSSTVGSGDLAILLGAWGPAVFDFGAPLDNPEAEQIGLEMGGPAGPLLVPPLVYDRIDRDLDLIRAFEPGLVGENHTPAWVPNELIVSLFSGAPLDEYQCLNQYYQVIEEDNLFGDIWVLTFAGNLNVVALAGIYAQAPEVEYAEPNGIIGGQNFWTPTIQIGGVWRWDIDDGFHDCFDGCDCHRFYVIQTNEAGDVSLISYQEFGAPWCEF